MSGHSPTVTIGVPVFNAERYLRPALDSILGQTYEDFDLIISDNASTDATAEICREYAARDGRIRYYRNVTNVGANRNFRRAFQLASGRYFKWAAHDDLCYPTFLARCVEVLDRDSSVVLCYTRTALIDDRGRLLSDEEIASGRFRGGSGEVVRIHEQDQSRRLDSPDVVRRFGDVILRTRWCFEIFGLIRREALVGSAALNELYYGIDKVMLAELSLRGRFAEVPEVLFLRRCHLGQSTNMASARARARWSHPGARGSAVIFPRLHCFWGYCRSVHRADLSWRERAACLPVLASWPFRRDRWVELGRSVLPAYREKTQ